MSAQPEQLELFGTTLVKFGTTFAGKIFQIICLFKLFISGRFMKKSFASPMMVYQILSALCIPIFLADSQITSQFLKLFRDNEFSNDFVYRQPVDIGKLKLQESEVAEVCWMDYEECREKIADVEIPNCINPEEIEKLGSYLGIC